MHTARSAARPTLARSRAHTRSVQSAAARVLRRTQRCHTVRTHGTATRASSLTLAPAPHAVAVGTSVPARDGAYPPVAHKHMTLRDTTHMHTHAASRRCVLGGCAAATTHSIASHTEARCMHACPSTRAAVQCDADSSQYVRSPCVPLLHRDRRLQPRLSCGARTIRRVVDLVSRNRRSTTPLPPSPPSMAP